MDSDYDVIVIGGGAAGLSGAVALLRSRRSVLVVDAGDPRNAPAGHVHNFLTQDGTPPADLYATGRKEVESYGGQLTLARVDTVGRDGELFRVVIDGRDVTARRLLVATGSRDELPDIPGLAQHWGSAVLHCPYCHGWEVRDRSIGVLATGPMATHQALMFRQLSTRVTLLQHTGPAPALEQQEQLAARGVPIVAGTVAAVEGEPGALSGVRLDDGTLLDLDALVVAPVCRARADLLAPLGLHPTEVRMGEHVLGTQIDADTTGATATAGVWVAGNVANVQAQVISSAAAGLAAGAAINADLIAADAERAVGHHRHGRIHGEQAWDSRYRSQPQTWTGNPNPALVAEVSDLSPGSALDAGAGEGGDARWLAARGWRVTAADISTVALERVARSAHEAGLDITPLHLDLTRDPAPETYDLVSASYLHLPAEQRRTVFAHLAAAVAPGGTLLVVGHDLSDLHTTMPRPGLAEMGWTTREVIAALGDGWSIDTCGERPRAAVDHDGAELTIHDVIVRAHRTP
jgi:thioredoxin reductase/SAM-dependent methyltransferase